MDHRATLGVCLLVLASCAVLGCSDSRVSRCSDCADGGAPPASPCDSDDDCADGVCRQSRVTLEYGCYARCPSELAGHLCEDGSECFGYCRGDQGPGELGDPCEFTEDCLPGLACFIPATGGRCTRICDVDHIDICESGTACELFPDGSGLCRTPE